MKEKTSKTKPWLENPMKGELKFKTGAGTEVVICPEKNHAGNLKDIDVIRLDLKNAKGDARQFWMTPDEALDISGALSSAVGFWLNFKYRPYMKKFNVRRNKLTKGLRKE